MHRRAWKNTRARPDSASAFVSSAGPAVLQAARRQFGRDRMLSEGKGALPEGEHFGTEKIRLALVAAKVRALSAVAGF